MFTNTQMFGVDLGFPDVCLTPPAMIPIPYPDIALGPTAIPVCFNILHCFAPVHNLFTITPITNGDNPGIATGSTISSSNARLKRLFIRTKA